MTKKFFDIVPPDKIAETDISVDGARAGFKKEKLVKPRKSKWIFPKVFLFLFAVSVVVVLFGFFFFPKAEIDIEPKKSSMKIEEEAVLDFNVQNADIQENIIPAVVIEKEKTVEKDFSSTGKTTAEKKASGMITVYNEYSESPRILVPSRFVSADGKLFWSTEKITIPGYKKEGSKIIPGQKDVKVEAVEAGEGYNIGPTTFALPALAGSKLYTTIYAKSFSSMAGGAVGEISQVTENDLESAEDITTKEAEDGARKDIMDSLSEEYVLLDQSISYEILKKESSLQKDSLSDSFKFKVVAKSSGFAFKKSDMDKFVANLIADNIKNEEKILQKSITTDYSLISAKAGMNGVQIKLSLTGETYKDINTEDIKNALLGKSIDEAKMLLSSLSDISEFNINNKPFLRRNIPDDPDKVEIRLIVD